MKKGILNEMVKSYNLNDIETHLVYSFLNSNKLDYSKNEILKNYFIDFKKNSKLYIDTFNLEITTIKELENYLELLIPAEDRKFNGAFFTPTYIVDFIIN